MYLRLAACFGTTDALSAGKLVRRVFLHAKRFTSFIRRLSNERMIPDFTE